MSIILDNFVVYRGDDHVPPSKVEGLKAYAERDGVKLEWKVAHDNVFPMVYVISRSGKGGKFKKIAENYRPYYIDKTVGRGIYKYRVLACDFQNNIGEWSDVVEVKSIATPIKSDIDQLIVDRENYIKHVKKIHEMGKGKVEKGLVVMYGDSLTAPTLYPQVTVGALGIYRVKAFGYEGMTTGWGKKNLENRILNRVKPEFMLLMFGTNNVRGVLKDNDTYLKWVYDLIDTAKKSRIKGSSSNNRHYPTKRV